MPLEDYMYAIYVHKCRPYQFQYFTCNFICNIQDKYYLVNCDYWYLFQLYVRYKMVCFRSMLTSTLPCGLMEGWDMKMHPQMYQSVGLMEVAAQKVTTIVHLYFYNEGMQFAWFHKCQICVGTVHHRTRHPPIRQDR